MRKLALIVLLLAALSAWVPIIYIDYKLRSVRDRFCVSVSGFTNGCALLEFEFRDYPAKEVKRVRFYGIQDGKHFRMLEESYRP